MKGYIGRKVRKAILRLIIPGLLAFQAVTASAQTNPFIATDLGIVTHLGGLNNVAGNELSLTLQKNVLTAGGGRRDRAFIVSPFSSDSRNTAELPSTNGATTVAFAVNDNRVAVGTNSGTPKRWQHIPNSGVNDFFTLPEFAECNFSPSAPVAFFNNTIVGSCTTSAVFPGGQTPLPIRWTANAGAFTVAKLRTATIPGFNIVAPGEARDMNSQGTVVGYQWNANFEKRAVIFRDNQDPQVLTMTGGTLSEARGISDSGFITGVGQFTTAYGVQSRGFIRTQTGAMIRALIPLAVIPQPTGNPYNPYTFVSFFIGGETSKINSSGLAVGTLSSINGQRQAILWNAAGAFTALSFQAGLAAGTLTEAVDINDNGDILAYGTVNGEKHGFLLRPTGIAFTFATGGY